VRCTEDLRSVSEKAEWDSLVCSWDGGPAFSGVLRAAQRTAAAQSGSTWLGRWKLRKKRRHRGQDSQS
jgi:hypothetical protein